MAEARIFKGYWWLPSSLVEKIAGVLTVKADRDPHWELFVAFGQEENA